MVVKSSASSPAPSVGGASPRSGGQEAAQSPLQTDLPPLSAVNTYSVLPAPSTRTEPSEVSPMFTATPAAAGADADSDAGASDEGASDAGGSEAGATLGAVVAPPLLLLHAATTRLRPNSGATRVRVRILGSSCPETVDRNRYAGRDPPVS